MNQDTTFSYKYSAKENEEVLRIREKYLPKSESRLDELKRLDNAVQTSGVTVSLVFGIIGSLIFGVGLCLAMQVIGSGIYTAALGVAVGLVGMAAMLVAYPIYKKIHDKTKQKYAPRILELAAEISGKKI